MKKLLYLLSQFMFVLIGGNVAPIGYVLGVLFSVIGFILTQDSNNQNNFLIGIVFAVLGLVIMFFRIRADVIELKGDD